MFDLLSFGKLTTFCSGGGEEFFDDARDQLRDGLLCQASMVALTSFEPGSQRSLAIDN